MPESCRSTRASTASVTVSGSASRAANSSSTKNGLPPARACSSSASAVGTGSPAIAASWWATSSRVERLEIDPDDAVTPRELGGQPAQLAFRPERRDDHDPLAAQVAREEHEQRQRRRIGPVDVLEHEQHRRGAGEQVEQQLVQPRGAAAAGSLPRQHRTEHAARLRRQVLEQIVDGQPAQRGGDRRVGQFVAAELQALAVQHVEPALARRRLDLPHEPRLADPGLAGHEHAPTEPPSSAPISARRGTSRPTTA